jgi:hypothetical protein
MMKGVCRYCGCTEEKPCRYVPNPHSPPAGQPADSGMGRQDEDAVHESCVSGESREGQREFLKRIQLMRNRRGNNS